MTNASETLDNRSQLSRLFRQFNRESTVLVIVAIAVIMAVISWLRAEKAIDDANKAAAVGATWHQMYKETERECRLAQLEIDDFRIAIAEAGIKLTHEDGSP